MSTKYFRKIDIVINVITWLVILGMFVLLIASWKSMPDQIPVHYNRAGEIDGWGKKTTALVIPIMAFMVCGMITLIEFIPQAWNIPMKVNQSNMEKVYMYSKNMITSVKLIVAIMCAYLSRMTVKCQPLSKYFLPVVLAAIFGSTLFWLVRMLIGK